MSWIPAGGIDRSATIPPLQAELTDTVRDESACHEDARRVGPSRFEAARLTKLTSDHESRMLALIKTAAS